MLTDSIFLIEVIPWILVTQCCTRSVLVVAIKRCVAVVLREFDLAFESSHILRANLRILQALSRMVQLTLPVIVC